MKKKTDFDLIIIGGGSAGVPVALQVAETGKKVAVIESGKWGGSDLNQSSVPLGALFGATNILRRAVEGKKFGLASANLRYNYPTLKNWKNVAMRRAGADDKSALESAGVVCIEGRGHLISATEVSDGENIYKAGKILLATGASTMDTGIKIGKDLNYLEAGDVADLPRPPRSIFIVGAGSSGCEFAQYFSALGCNVVIADYAGRLLPREDEEVGQVLDYVFNQKGIKVLTQSRVIGIGADGSQKRVIFLRGGLEKTVKVDEILLCTGLAPNTDIGLENAGVKYDGLGIEVDERMRTSVKNIYACGDVVPGESSPERVVFQIEKLLPNLIRAQKSKLPEPPFLRITKTTPEVAKIGMTEDDCLRRDRPFVKVVLPLGEIPQSNLSDFSDGFIKLICEKNGKIIGATVMAPHAVLLIQEIALAIQEDLTISHLATLPHARYEWSELIREAARQML